MYCPFCSRKEAFRNYLGGMIDDKETRRHGDQIRQSGFRGCESVERVKVRLMQDFTYYYYIYMGPWKVGAVRVVDRKEAGRNKRISPIFVLPRFQGRGIAQQAIRLCEEIHGGTDWELDTIL